MNAARTALVFLASVLAASAQEVWPDAATLPDASFPHLVSRAIDLGKGHKVDARFGLTERGNGGLEIPGIGVRVYDAEKSDGTTYAGYLLRCEWRDLNADGYLDLVVSGAAQIWAGKSDAPRYEKTVQAAFHYDPARRRFVKMACPPEIYLFRELPADRDSSSQSSEK
jgi:hypothetical protein